MKTPTIKNQLSLKLRALLILGAMTCMARVASANTELWAGTNGVSATTNWSDNANWINVTGGGGPGPNGNDVVFGDGDLSGLGVINSVVDANLLNPFSLTFTNNSANGNFQTVLIPAGIAVTNANGLTVGIRLSTANSYQTTVGFVGGGTLVQNGALQVDNSTTVGTSGQLPWLDLSGLTNFIYTNATGTITVAGTSSGSEARGSGRLDLAGGTNLITVGTLNVALGTGNGGIGGTINLGAGTNTLNVGTVNLAAGKINNATVKFLTTTGGLRIRGVTGADDDRNVTMTLGNRSNSGSGNPTGTLSFIGGNPVDVKVNTITLGKSNQSGTGTGNVAFDTGTFDVTTINMAVSSSTGGCTGNITNSGGFLIVSNISMLNQTGTGVATGNLYINGAGTVIVSNSIVKTTTNGVANITMAGGTLIVGTNIGAPGNAIDNLSVGNSTLTLPAKLTASVYATNLTASGTTNTVNVTSVPAFFAYPAQFPLISYVNALADNTTFTNGTLPGTLQGYISNNVTALTIDIVITNGPAFAAVKSIRWNGSPTGDWTTNTSTLNWLTNSTAVNYNQGDTVTFDDTLTGTANVNLTQALFPGEVIMNNSSVNYLFTGIGKITGSTSLTKTGTGQLIVDNSGINDFVDGVTISAGTLQVGNNDTNGNLPAIGSWVNNGTLVFSRSDNLTISQVISGTGSLVQNGNGKLTLNAADTYSGSTIVSKGTLALTSSGSVVNTSGIFPQGGAFDVSTADPSVVLNVVGADGGTLVLGTNTVNVGALSLTNSTITLAADYGKSQNMNVTTLTTAGSTNIINVTGVLNAGGQSIPSVIPLIKYTSANFAGGFNLGETNFPNAYVTNDAVNSTIDLVLTATPYVVTWNGGSLAGNNWTDSNNWSGLPIYPGDALFFDGTTRLTPFNDTAAGTTYSNITFNAGAGAFTLSGNPVTLTGGVVNNSTVSQTVNLPLDFSSSISLNGTSAPLIIAGGLTNTQTGVGSTTLTLTGTGILTNLFGSAAANGGTNLFVENDGSGNWTLLDNAASTTVIAPWAFTINDGTFNFGSASSAPKVISTSPQGVPSDNQVGGSAGVATLNISNGLFTTSARLNTGGNSSSGTINQYGGLVNIASQFQGANGGASATSAVNLYGGTMNIGVSVASTNTSQFTTNFGTFFVASRGNGSLTVTNSALLNCGTLDVERVIVGGVTGTVNLNGGTIVANRVGTATANQNPGLVSTANFYFNGGTLKARTNSTTFFQGRTTDPVTPINAYVTARGANIDSDTNSISFLEPLLTDPGLVGAADGGLTKLGTGTLTLAGTNTYIGNTLVGAGTLLVTGQGLSAVTVSNGATLGGNGVIGSNVTVNVGGTLSPGTTGLGVLTVGGNVTLAGTTTMELDKTAGTNDLLLATNTTPATITYGGTLNLPVIAGTLAPGDKFKLFSADNYTGSFTTITPSDVTWNTSNLNVDGTLTVVSVGSTGPTTNAMITKVTLSGTNLLVHGTNNNVPNTAGHYVVLTATNLSTPLSNWTAEATNSYTNGTFDFSIPVVPGTAQKYIDVQAVP